MFVFPEPVNFQNGGLLDCNIKPPECRSVVAHNGELSTIANTRLSLCKSLKTIPDYLLPKFSSYCFLYQLCVMSGLDILYTDVFSFLLLGGRNRH